MSKLQHEFTMKQKKIFAVAIIIAFSILTVLAFCFLGEPMLKLVSEPDNFRAWIDNQGIFGKLIYMGMVIFQVLIAVIPGEPLEIAGGYAFGAIEGTILCMLAATFGSLLVFYMVRCFGTKLVEIFFPKEKIESLRFLHISKNKEILFLLVFMLPGTPKDLLCYFAGLTNIKFSAWLLICSFGRLPSIVTSTVGGSALGEKNYWFAAIIFVCTFIVSAIGLLIYDRICKKNENKAWRGDIK